jgi:hypothetical protein
MLEVAYVLPIVVFAILLIVEAVAFAMNSFAAYDVLTDVHTAISSEVSDVANFTPTAGASGLSPTPLYAICDDGQVKLPVGDNTALTAHVKGALKAKGVVFVTSKPSLPPSANITVTDLSGFHVYVIKFQAVANSVVMPNFLSVLLPMEVNTIISLKDTCTPSP